MTTTRTKRTGRPPSPDPRHFKLSIRLRKAEEQLLKDLAAEMGCSPSALAQKVVEAFLDGHRRERPE